MPTPAIQTLITDAQQVLNLKSLSEIRATMAAALANANVGTPLNPNLTTQQLWDQFYLIVRQPESDIESIITNQLMKFLYAPPAPGGVGANGQVIFNDGGVLAGDAGLTYNKTTDALTITGDLTVATDRLKVVTGSTAIQTGATTQLQVGTTSWPSTVIGKSGSRSLFGNTGEVVIWNEAAPAIGNYSTLFVTAKTGAGATTMGGLQIRAGIENASNSDGFVSLWTSNSVAGGFVERYKIDSTGVSTWSNVGGVAGTGLTLNATSNLVLKGGTAAANGVGVTFPATQVASSDANCLDDYEEGTFIPEITFGGNSTGITYSQQTLRYTKVGRVVSVQGLIALSNKGSSVGQAVITGLPFIIANSTSAYSAVSIWLSSVTPAAGGSANQAYGVTNTQVINLSTYKTDGSYSNLTDANFANNSELILNLTYTV